MKKYFIVASHGWSATNWLSLALNKHPDITTSHSAANLYERKLENDIAGMITEFHTGYVGRCSSSIDSAYDKIEKFSDTAYYGSVHLYRLRDLPILFEKFGSTIRRFVLLNLIRNPFDLVVSGAGQFNSLFRTDINELHWTLGKVLEHKEFLFDLQKEHEINIGDFENLAFIGACRVLGSLKLDIDTIPKLEHIPFVDYQGVVRMEDITQKPESYVHLIHSITGATDNLPDHVLKEVYDMDKINGHRCDGDAGDSRKIFESFPAWKKEVLRYFIAEYEIVKSYKNFGYELDFLK